MPRSRSDFDGARKRTQTYALRQFHRVPLLQLTDDRRARRDYRSLCSDTDHEDRIAFVHLAPLQTYGEHAGITAMISCEIPQQLGCSFGQGPVFCLLQGPKVTSVRTIKHIHTTPMKIDLGMRCRKNMICLSTRRSTAQLRTFITPKPQF